MRAPSVVVTGMGIVSALGCGAEAVWRSLRAGAAGLGALTLFQSPRCGHFPVGQVRDDLVALGAPDLGSRSDRMAFLAVHEALEGARLLGAAAAPLPERAGIVLGATVGGILSSERFLSCLVRGEEMFPYLLRYHESACSVDLCAKRFGLGGPSTTVSAACSSGAMAIAVAADLIEAGEADIVVAGGVDSLCGLTLNGFSSLLLLDPRGCRPFDAARSGLSLGEGAGAIVLEREAPARRRGAPVIARLTGWGRTCDAYHVTAPDPDGRGAADAMRAALARAGIEPADVGYVNAHGTGTRDNDLAEAKALRRLFGNRLPPVSSSKGFFGHTLAASGAVEAVVSILALRDGWLPPNPGFTAADPEIGFEPLRAGRPAEIRHVLSNSFGFGGNNTALAFSSAAPAAATSPARAPEPEPRRAHADIPVMGLGVVSPAGATPEAVFEAARRGRVEPREHVIGPPLPPGRAPVCACPEIPDAERLPPARRRRLSRLLEMTIVAARTARRDAAGRGDAAPPEETAVLIGTGLGGLKDTADFLVNMIVNDERTPMPARFVNSVHNALPGQTAIEIGARRMNCASVQREISFESALWQACRLIETGEARGVLVGAADEITSYVVAARQHWRWWTSMTDPDESEAPASDAPPPLAGEGAAMVALGRAEDAARPRARVSAVAIGRHRRDGRDVIDAEAECRWIEAALARDGGSLGSIDLVLTGATGWGRTDAMYRAVADALSRRAGRSVPHAAYNGLCGDYCSASAFGFVVAVGLVGGDVDPRALLVDGAAGGEGAARPVRRVLLYTLGRNGEKGMCCVRG